MGGFIQLFGVRGGDFQELGHCPLFGFFCVSFFFLNFILFLNLT